MIDNKKRKEKSTLSVLLNDDLINKGSAVDTFTYVINHISNLVGKENLCKDFSNVFNTEGFINGKFSNKTYNSTKDDSNKYFIKTHYSTEYKKTLIEAICSKYNISVEVSISTENTFEILTDTTTDDTELLSNIITDEEILSNINDATQATLDIKRCLTDYDFLCDKLNNTDKNYISSYYRRDSGVVIDIRKDVAKEILLGGVNKDRLLDIIKEHKDKNPQKLKTWSNPYKILHPLVNHSYIHIDKFFEKFIKRILIEFEDYIKYGVSDFNGSQHQGSDNYWVAFYNKNHKHQSDGLQFFITFENGEMRYGIYRYIDKVHISQFVFDGDIDKFYNFIRENKSLILNDVLRSSDIITDEIKNIIQDNNNIALSYKEIIERLSTKIDKNTFDNIIEGESFEKTEDSKYKLKNYMPTKLKELFESNGFITIDVLKQILEQNGIKINI